MESTDTKHHVDRLGPVTLIGINDTSMPQNDLGPSVAVSLPATRSGEVLGIALIMQEDGSGAIIAEAGELYIFNADPSISAGDATIPAAQYPNIIGKVAVAATDWNSDVNGACAYLTTPVAFPDLATIYLAYRHTGATTINSAAGDDEKLRAHLTVRYDR